MIKTKAKKKKVKTERQKAVDHADKWCSLFVRKFHGKCVTCGATENLQAGHLITRAKYSTRWLFINVPCQCNSCNLRHEYQPEHLTRWFINKYGAEKYDELVTESNTPKKLSTDEIKEIGDEYKRMYEGLPE